MVSPENWHELINGLVQAKGLPRARQRLLQLQGVTRRACRQKHAGVLDRCKNLSSREQAAASPQFAPVACPTLEGAADGCGCAHLILAIRLAHESTKGFSRHQGTKPHIGCIGRPHGVLQRTRSAAGALASQAERSRHVRRDRGHPQRVFPTLLGGGDGVCRRYASTGLLAWQGRPPPSPALSSAGRPRQLLGSGPVAALPCAVAPRREARRAPCRRTGTAARMRPPC
eukprot:scaffold7594_cov417-Prasinococcus_capsulatus_cf.AAC.4